MADSMLAKVGSVPLTAERAHWEQQRERQPRPRSRPASARNRLVARVLPGVDPELCEVGVVLNAEGVPFAVAISDARTGRELLRLSLDDQALIGSAHSGLFFERKG